MKQHKEIEEEIMVGQDKKLFNSLIFEDYSLKIKY